MTSETAQIVGAAVIGIISLMIISTATLWLFTELGTNAVWYLLAVMVGSLLLRLALTMFPEEYR